MAGKFSSGSFLAGMTIGVVAVLAGTDRWQTVRPVAKGALRAGVHGFRAMRRAAAHAAEEFEDLLAETIHEIDGEPGGAAKDSAGTGSDA